MRLYFCYGSNLNRAQMQKRCPGARPYMRAALQGYTLAWYGVLSIKKKKGASVEGALWYTSDSDENRLDRYEGCPRLYGKYWAWVDIGNKRKTLAYVYIMNVDGKQVLPGIEYLDACLQGARDWGIPENYMIDTLPLGGLEYENWRIAEEEESDRIFAGEFSAKIDRAGVPKRRVRTEIPACGAGVEAAF